MKKFAVLAVIVSLSAPAYAGGSAFADLVSRAGSVEIQAPEPSRAMPVTDLQLADITDKCSVDGEVPTAFPAAYAAIPAEENILVTRVYRFTARDGAERKIEVVITGGDWMQYPFIYFVTNAGRASAAYFVPALSTSDRENGEVAPEVDFHDEPALRAFILDRFLDRSGVPQTAYTAVK